MVNRPSFSPISVAIPAFDLREGGDCCITVPSGSIALILGALNGFIYNDSWTGSPEQINQTILQVETLIVDIMLCGECPTENGKDCDCESCAVPSGGGGGGCGNCEDCMAGCVTDITIEDGIIYKWYGECCKVAVGTLTSVDVPGPIGDEDEADPPTWGCNKAAGIAKELGAVILAGVTELIGTTPGSVVVAAPYQQAWLNAFPGIPWDRDVLWVAMNWYSQREAVIDLEVTDIDFEQWLACGWKPYMLDTSGLSLAEYQSMNGSQPAGFSRETYQFVGYILTAAGFAYSSRLAQSYYNEPGVCACPSGPIEASAIWFNGATQGPTGGTGCVMEEVLVVDSGRRVLCTLAGSNGVNRSMEDFDFGLSGAADGDSIKFRIYLSQDEYMPAEAWEEYETPAPEADWHPIVTQPPGDIETRENGTEWVEFYNESDPLETMLWCRMRDARFYPFDNDPSQGGWRTHWYIEIVEVNGVPLTPIGP